MLSASANGHSELLRYLHAQGASFLAEAQGQLDTALHLAAANGHAECVRFILASGLNIDTGAALGETALHRAAREGHTAVVQLLLDAGADIDTKDNTGGAPLADAMFGDQPEVVTLLVARGAELIDGLQALVGVASSSAAALKALLTSSQWLAMSRAERMYEEGLLLHLVQDISTLYAVRHLVLDMPALVRHQRADGTNALHSAARDGKAVPLICALIKEGVDPTTRNNADQTPADMASEAGHTLQATLLERAAEDKRRRDLQQQNSD